MGKKIGIVIGFIISLVVGLLIGIFVVPKKEVVKEVIKEVEKEEDSINNIEVKENNNKKYYIITGDYNGDYDYQEIDLSEYHQDYDLVADKIKLFNTTEVVSYGEYVKFCNRWNLKQKYNDNKKRYMIISFASYGQPIVEARLAEVVDKDDNVSIYMWENTRGNTADIGAYFMAIPVDSSTYTFNINMAYTEEEYNNIVKYGSTQDPSMMTEDKPIIYIYPEKETNVNVKLLRPELLSVSYPKYTKEWNVIASSDGNLKDITTNKNYYGLYYEAKNHNVTVKEDGFVIEGKDTTKFFEEKLSLLGLNEREINEFIIYWLPKMENNKYNYIRFETKEEIDSFMPLEINPKPDTLIRVVMDFKALDEKINVKEQKLTKVERNGYTVVEWGGSEIK